MSNKFGGLVIHPLVAEFVDPVAIKVMLDVRDDLRAGRIENFDMSEVYHWCGTPACIAGHVNVRLGCGRGPDRWSAKMMYGCLGNQFMHLFSSRNPSDPLLAADAIDHFLTTGKGNWPCHARL